MTTGSIEDDLSSSAVRAALGSARPLRLLATTGSTNADALEWGGAGARHGSVVVTDHQTAGRGRRRRAWQSEPGRALQLSLILRPGLPPGRLSLLTTGVGVAVAEAIEDLCDIPTRTKWPNDVNCGGRKLAGILVETLVDYGLVCLAVVGVGINVAWSCAEVPGGLAARATSVDCELERVNRRRRAGRASILAAVVDRIEGCYEGAIVTTSGGARLLAQASERSETLGREVRVSLSTGERVEGIATRLLPNGALELRAGQGVRCVDAGEVEHLRAT